MSEERAGYGAAPVAEPQVKPCPLCGKQPTYYEYSDEKERRYRRAVCQNDACWLYGEHIPLEDWNARPLEDALRERDAILARLEAAVKDGTFADELILAGHRSQVVMGTFEHPDPEFAGLYHGEWQQMKVKRVLEGALLAARGDREGLSRLIGGQSAFEGA